MAVRKLSVVLDLDTSRWNGKLSGAKGDVLNFGGAVRSTGLEANRFSATMGNVGRSMSSPTARLRDLMVILGQARSAFLTLKDVSVGWLGAIFKQAGEIERLTVLMKGLSTATTDIGKSKEAQQSLSSLYQIARTSGFAVQELAQSFVKIKSGGIDPMNGSLRGLVDATAAFGGNSDTLNRAAIAIQQMAGKGVISMEELRQQLGEAVPSAMSLMARAMGKSMPELAKMIQKGTVQAKPALAAMFAEMERVYHGSGEKLANTLFGQMAQVKSNWAQLTTDFTGMGQKDSFFGRVVGEMKQLNTLMRSTEARSFLASFGAGVGNVAGLLVSVIKTVVQFKDQVGFAAKALATVWAMKTGLAWANSLGQMLNNLAGYLTNLGANMRTLFSGVDNGTVAQIRYNMAVATGRVTILGSAQAEAQRARAAAAGAAQAVVNENNRLVLLKLQETQLRATQAAQNAASRAGQLAASQNVVMARAAAAAAEQELIRVRELAIAKATKNMASDPAIQAARAQSIAMTAEEQAAIERLSVARAQADAAANNSALTRTQRAQQIRTALRQQTIAESELAQAQRNAALAAANLSRVEGEVRARRLAGRAETAQEISAKARLATATAGVTAAISRETAAMAGNAVAGKGKVSVGFQILANVERQILAEAALVRAQNAETASTVESTLATRAAALAKGVYSAATGVAAVATTALGAAVNLALGPVGIIAMLAYQAATAFGVFETAADRATAAAQRMRQGFQEAGDAAKVAMQRANLAAEARELNEDMGKGIGVSGQSHQNTGNGAWFVNDASRKKRLAEIKKEDDDLVGARAAGQQTAYVQRQQQWQNKVTSDHDAFLDRLSQSYVREQQIRTKGVTDQKKIAAIDAELRAKYDKKASGDLQNRIGSLQAMVDARTAKGLKSGPMISALRQLKQQADATNGALEGTANAVSGGGGGKSSFPAAMAAGAGNVAKLKAQLDGSAGNLAKFNAEVAAGAPKYKGWSKAQLDVVRGQMAMKDALTAAKGGQADAANAADDLDTRLTNLAGKIAGLRDELQGGEGDLASFNAQFEAGAFKGVPQEKIDQMREYLKIVESLNRQKDVKASTGRLDAELSKSRTEADALWKSFSSGTMETDKRLAQITSRFAGLTDGLKGDDLASANATIDKIVQNFKDADAADIAQGWSDAAIEMRNSLLSENDQRQKNYELEVARQRRLIELTAAGSQRRLDMEKAFAEWDRGSKAQLARQNEGAITRMGRDWAKMGQGIQSTMADAVASYADGIGEAEFNTGEFVLGVVKSLMKVILTAMIAYAILSAIGMANNSDGKHVSMGSFLKGQMGAGVGLNNGSKSSIGYSAAKTPVAHTGGVIGGALKTVSGVNPAIFANAAKYHTGGFIGERPLQPGEHPIIAKEKELMLTEDQQNLLGRRLAGGGGVAPSVKIDFINNSGTDMEAEASEPSFNGKDWVIGIVTEATSKQGPLRTALKQLGAG